MDPEASAPYLLKLLGVQEGTEPIAMLTPEAIRTRTFETLRQMHVNSAQQHPLIVEIEDLHWLDQTSEAYLASLAENLAGAKILLLTSYRPGYQPPWLGKSYATQISLQHLEPQDALAIVHATAPGGVLSDQQAQTIIEKAEGNPFFLEELARSVAESGASTVEIAVPNTIQGVLSARIDRLPDSDKQLLQTASVLGREFSLALLQAIWDTAADTELMLQALKRQEFLFERTEEGEPLYVFKHALTQDVAYESLLNARRQALHLAAGRALERLYADRLEEVYYHLAYHYLKANAAEKAVNYLSLLIDKAMQGYAYAEAVIMGQQALAQAEQLRDERDQTIIELAIRQAESLFWLGRRQESIDFLLSHQARLEGLQNTLLVGQYYLWLGYIYSFQGDRQRAQQYLKRALAEGTASQNAVIMGRAHIHLSIETRFAGDPAQAHYHAQQSVKLLEDTTERYWLGMALYFLGLSYNNIDGRFHKTIEISTRLQQMSEQMGDRRLQTNALTTMGIAYRRLGENEASLETLEHALTVSPDAFETAYTLGQYGYTQLQLGDIVGAIEALEQSVDQADLYRSRQVQSVFRSLLSEAYSQNHQLQLARNMALQGLQMAEEVKFPAGIRSARHSLGRIACANGHWTEAEAHLKSALETMRGHRLSYIHPQIYLDLAALAHAQGEPDTTAVYLCKAFTAFQKLHIPKYVESTEQLAQEYGVTLVEVELDDLTEGDG